MRGVMTAFDAAAVALSTAFLIRSTPLLLVALLATRMTKSSRLRSATIKSALLAAALLPFLGVLADLSGLSLRLTPPKRIAAPLIAETSSIPLAPTAVEPSALPPSASALTAPVSEAPPAAPVRSGPPFGLGLLWAVGSIILLARLAYFHAKLLRVRLRSHAVDDPRLTEALARLCAQYRIRPPRLLVSDGPSSPCLTGIFSPAILLPAEGMESLLNEGRLERVLSHELAHLARRDCAWNLLAHLLHALGFFQPLLWFIPSALDRANEEVADDLVLTGGADAGSYARDLLLVAERFMPSRPECVAGLTLGRRRSSLSARIRRMLSHAHEPEARLSWRRRAGALAAIGAVAFLCASVGLAAQKEESPAPAPRASAPAEDAANDFHVPSVPTTPYTTTGEPLPAAAADGTGLEAALDYKFDRVELPGLTLAEVLAILQTMMERDCNFVVDPGWNTEDLLVTLSVRNVTLHEALNLILKPNGADFAVWNGTIFISSQPRLQRLTADASPAAAPDMRNAQQEALLNKGIARAAFPGITLREAIEIIKTMIGEDLNVVLDPGIAAEAGTLVQIDVRNVTLRQALRQMLEPMGMGFYVKDGAVFITTRDNARRATMRTAFYDVKDLIRRRQWIPFLMKSLIDNTGRDNWCDITSTRGNERYEGTAPAGVGGWGQLDITSGVLAISQTPDVHDRIRVFLDKFRADMPEREEPETPPAGDKPAGE